MGERPREAWGCIQGGGPRGPRGDGSQGFRVSSCNNCTRPVLRPLGTSPQEGCGGVPAVQPGQTQFFPGHKVEDRRAPPSSGPSLTLQAAAPAVSPALPGWAFLPSVPHDTAGLGACYRRGPDVGSQSVLSPLGGETLVVQPDWNPGLLKGPLAPDTQDHLSLGIEKSLPTLTLPHGCLAPAMEFRAHKGTHGH